MDKKYNISYLDQESQDIQNFILTYKVRQCEMVNQENHEQTKCHDFHSIEERRRQPFLDNGNLAYSKQQCIHLTKLCQMKDACDQCHEKEQLYHPLFYKTEQCQNYYECTNSRDVCPYYHHDEQKRQPFGPFAKIRSHSDSEKVFSADYDKLTNFQIQKKIKKQLKLPPTVNLETFKTEPCNITVNHNLKQCEFYHNEKDKRRNPKKFYYNFDLCENKNCTKGDMCQYSHNKVEQLYHKFRFKSKFCKYYTDKYFQENIKNCDYESIKNYQNLNIKNCEYEKFCAFAHDEYQIEIHLVHKLERNDQFYLEYYKTIWCPYTNTHDRGTCVYAHNVQDYRRDPQKFQLEPKDCESWIKESKITEYNQGGCPKGELCQYCHGWKELEYHFLVYKTKECTAGQNCHKQDCAYYHDIKERRDINKLIRHNTQPSVAYPQAIGQPLNSFSNSQNCQKIVLKQQYNHVSNYQQPIKTPLHFNYETAIFNQNLQSKQIISESPPHIRNYDSDTTKSRGTSNDSYHQTYSVNSNGTKFLEEVDVNLQCNNLNIAIKHKPNSCSEPSTHPSTPDVLTDKCSNVQKNLTPFENQDYLITNNKSKTFNQYILQQNFPQQGRITRLENIEINKFPFVKNDYEKYDNEDAQFIKQVVDLNITTKYNDEEQNPEKK